MTAFLVTWFLLSAALIAFICLAATDDGGPKI